MRKIGKVLHYYDKIGVAVVKLENALEVGDKVKLSRGDDSFEQTVESMQLDHKSVEKGKKGEEIAMKVDKPAKEGTLVESE